MVLRDAKTTDAIAPGALRPERWLAAAVTDTPVPKQPDFPKSPHPDQVNTVLETVAKFASTLQTTFGMIASLDPTHAALTLHIAQQYYHIVVAPALQWARGLQGEQPGQTAADVQQKTPSKSDGLFCNLEAGCDELRRTLYPDDADSECSPSVWIPRTIFDVAYSVIMSQLGPNLSATDRSQIPLPILSWLDQLREKPRLGPFAVVFDFERQLVGTSVPLWGHCNLLKQWQTEVRSVRFPEKVKDHLTEVRRILHRVIDENPQADKKSLIGLGRDAMADELGMQCLSARLCRGSQWLSTDWDLRPLDQCSGCQVIYAGVTPIVGNSPEPYKRLGANFSTPWQCAESHVLAQIFELEASEENGASTVERGILSREEGVEV